MNALTSLQIDLIRGDIRQNGVELHDLQDDLLDHICCAIEMESSAGGAFEDIYMRIKQEIFPEGYRKVQESTTELLTQKYNNMKKAMNRFGIGGSALLLIGSIMKLLRLPGAMEGLILGALALLLGYLPLLLILSLKQTDTLLGKFRNFSGYIGANLMITGITLQVMHWSYGKEILFMGFAIFLIVFTPLFFKSLGKDAMLKIQPATLTVLLVAVVSALFAFSIKRPSLAYINSLLAVNANIEQSYEQKKERLLDIRKGESELSQAADQTLNYIEALKSYLVSTVDKKNVSGDLNIYNIFIYDKKLDDILVHNRNQHAYSGEVLEGHIQHFLHTLHKEKPNLKTFVSNTEEGKSWTETHFFMKPLYGSYTTLSNFQQEIVELEMEARLSK